MDNETLPISWTCHVPGEHVGVGENADGREIKFVARHRKSTGTSGYWIVTAWRQDEDRDLARLSAIKLVDTKTRASQWLASPKAQLPRDRDKARYP